VFLFDEKYLLQAQGRGINTPPTVI